MGVPEDAAIPVWPAALDPQDCACKEHDRVTLSLAEL